MQNPLFPHWEKSEVQYLGYNTKSIWVTYKLDITHNVMQLQKKQMQFYIVSAQI